MSEETIDLARLAVACPRWRWLPGMLAATPFGAEWAGFGADRVRVQSEWEASGPCGAPDGAVPDLTDPATLGCLVALVREAWGDPGFYAAQSSTKIKGADIFGWDTFGYLHGKSCRGMLYRSEAEALVAALEAAQ